MGINLNESRGLDQKQDRLLDPTYTGDLERGMIMVYSGNMSANGEQLVVPCSGTSSEKVAGCLWYSDTMQTSVPTIEVADVPASAPYTITGRFAPTNVNTMRVIRTDTGATVTAVAGAPGAGQVGLTGRTLTADSSLAGVTLQFTYRYAISAAQLARRGGRRSFNTAGIERVYNQCTLLYRECRLLLSNFDTAQAYDPVTNKTVRTGAGGYITTAGSGVAIGQVFQSPVLKLTPGIEQAFVGVEIAFPRVP